MKYVLSYARAGVSRATVWQQGDRQKSEHLEPDIEAKILFTHTVSTSWYHFRIVYHVLQVEYMHNQTWKFKITALQTQ